MAHMIDIGAMTEAEREAWEERAAIMEFDGEMSREEAELRALVLRGTQRGE